MFYTITTIYRYATHRKPFQHLLPGWALTKTITTYFQAEHFFKVTNMQTKEQLTTRIAALKAQRMDLEEQKKIVEAQLDGTKNEIAFLIGQLTRQTEIDNEKKPARAEEKTEDNQN